MKKTILICGSVNSGCFRRDRDVGSKTTYGMPIICPLVQNWRSGVESLSLSLSIFHERFPLTLGFFPENEEISAPPPCVDCRLLIGIYLFYENWSTETFGKKGSRKCPGC